MPLDSRRDHTRPLSPELRDLLGKMTCQDDDDRRLSIVGALAHPWFTGNEEGGCPEGELSLVKANSWQSAPVTAPLPEPGCGWHMMTAHFQIVQEYHMKHGKFCSIYDEEHPYELDHPDVELNTSIEEESLRGARHFDMKYYKTKGAKPYACVGKDELRALQHRFPRAVPKAIPAEMLDECGQHVSRENRAPQLEMLQFVKESITKGKLFQPKMYQKQGAFARQITADHPIDKIQQVDEEREADNPVCFCFCAPWVAQDEHGDTFPAPCNVSLGDYIGLSIEGNESDHVWKVERSHFQGKAREFTLRTNLDAPQELFDACHTYAACPAEI